VQYNLAQYQSLSFLQHGVIFLRQYKSIVRDLKAFRDLCVYDWESDVHDFDSSRPMSEAHLFPIISLAVTCQMKLFEMAALSFLSYKNMSKKVLGTQYNPSFPLNPEHQNWWGASERRKMHRALEEMINGVCSGGHNKQFGPRFRSCFEPMILVCYQGTAELDDDLSSSSSESKNPEATFDLLEVTSTAWSETMEVLSLGGEDVAKSDLESIRDSYIENLSFQDVLNNPLFLSDPIMRALHFENASDTINLAILHQQIQALDNKVEAMIREVRQLKAILVLLCENLQTRSRN